MPVYNENQAIKVIHVTENFSWVTTSYIYHQIKNLPYQGTKITDNAKTQLSQLP